MKPAIAIAVLFISSVLLAQKQLPITLAADQSLWVVGPDATSPAAVDTGVLTLEQQAVMM